jgi:hypothetical protein
MIGPSGLFNNLPPICNPRFNFIGASENNQLIKLGCEKYFLQGPHIRHALTDVNIHRPPFTNLGPKPSNFIIIMGIGVWMIH